jgi:hypothetical protein
MSNDIRPTVIVILLFGLMFVGVIGITAIVSLQETQICLDHPTYRKCSGWGK